MRDRLSRTQPDSGPKPAGRANPARAAALSKGRARCRGISRSSRASIRKAAARISPVRFTRDGSHGDTPIRHSHPIARIRPANGGWFAIDIMGMQDITGHFALPLARPFSELPPPFGRRRTPFVKSKRPKPSVFNLHGTREAPVSATVRAADFGSDNKPWVKPGPVRHRLRPTLLMLVAGLVFGAACIAATHTFEARKRAQSPDTVYEAAISMMPAAVAATPVAATIGSGVSDGMEAALPPPGIVQAMRDEAEQALGASSPAAAAAKPAVAARRKPVRASDAMRAHPAEAVSTSAAAAGAASRARAERHGGASAAASESSPAKAVGMTAAEFKQWLTATREPSNAAAASPSSDLHVALPGHTRLTDVEASAGSAGKQ
ncbi:TPA: hypothetical protein ACW2VG_002892 [Burkholderia stabilis]